MVHCKPTLLAAGAAALGALSAATPSGAQTDRLQGFEVEASVGYEYDSVVAVSEIDQFTDQGDSIALVDLDLDYERSFGAIEADLGYSFSQKTYETFSEFDRQIHIAVVGASRDFGKIELEGAYRYVHATLDNDAFLTLNYLTLAASSYISDRVFVRGDYVFTDKSFDRRATRDAQVSAVGGDVYYFFNGVRRYLVAGYDFEIEDANADEFDFNAHKLRVRFNQRVAVGDRDLEARVGWRYEKRDYDAVTPSISEIRDDERHRFSAELEIPITNLIFAQTEYEYADFSSNLPSANFEQNVASIRLGVRF